MDLEVRHLRLVEAVDAAGSVTKAATGLGVSQPALTAQVRRIEHVVGGPVFDRGRHGARPTPLGEVLLPHIRDVLAALDDLHRAVRHFQGRSGSRTLRLAVRQTPFASQLCGVVGEVCPDDVVDLSVVDRQATVLAALADGTVDLALHVDFSGQQLVLPPGIRKTVVGSEPMFVMIAPEHPLADRDEVELAELGGCEWLLAVNGDDEFDRHLSAQCDLAGIGPITVRAYAPLVATQLIRRGEPVVAPVQALNTGLPMTGKVLPLRGSPVRVRHILLWSEDGPIDAERAERIRAGLVTAYGSLVDELGRLPGWWDRNDGWLGSARGVTGHAPDAPPHAAPDAAPPDCAANGPTPHGPRSAGPGRDGPQGDGPLSDGRQTAARGVKEHPRQVVPFATSPTPPPKPAARPVPPTRPARTPPPSPVASYPTADGAPATPDTPASAR
ncbi:LysR family transcriptional regulator [Streptomyces zagrosensis]|uniref:DNA-binding transcriptional LysR family regulator n=1 Tax=Streptomyces zagrosensis TaxID=1042984 RepID=A0A7W9UYE5_9ACTN|nr:LysR family transcriptional regulator [Streptomyces zagrosensis]MBB5935868.1 DNA-binding transcriptional LysR family regulator [Streptomyces zagrosensis]